MGYRWSPSLLSERAFGSNQGNGGLLLHSWHIGIVPYKWSTLYLLYPQMVYKFCIPFVLQKICAYKRTPFYLQYIVQHKIGVLFGVQMYDYFCSHICTHKIMKFAPTKSRRILYSICTHKYFVPHLYLQIYIDKMLILRYNLYINNK